MCVMMCHVFVCNCNSLSMLWACSLLCMYVCVVSRAVGVAQCSQARLPHGLHGHGQHHPRSGVVIVVVLTASSRVAVAVTAVVE